MRRESSCVVGSALKHCLTNICFNLGPSICTWERPQSSVQAVTGNISEEPEQKGCDGW